MNRRLKVVMKGLGMVGCQCAREFVKRNVQIVGAVDDYDKIIGMDLGYVIGQAPLGIKAMVIQPGAFRTRFYDGESLQGSATEISDYASTAGKTRVGRFENKHAQPGDPDKAGEVIVRVVNGDEQPEILTLGKAAVTAVKSTLEAKIAELDKWAEVSAACDFDE